MRHGPCNVSLRQQNLQQKATTVHVGCEQLQRRSHNVGLAADKCGRINANKRILNLCKMGTNMSITPPKQDVSVESDCMEMTSSMVSTPGHNIILRSLEH